MLILLYAVVSFGYFGMAAWAWWRAAPRTPVWVMPRTQEPGAANVAPAPFGMGERFLLMLVWAIHLLLLGNDFYSPNGVRFGFASALSATMWLAVAIFWIESLYFPLSSMRLLIFPLAGLCALLPFWFPGTTALTSVGATRNPAFDAHLVVALAAYGLLTLAALHALLMAALDRWLHQADTDKERADAGLARLERAVLGQLPPLLTMERLLFRLVTLGFVLLTLTVLTGVVFSEALFDRPIVFDHKTIFTLIAWAIFAALLAGRALYGWRGRVALRWTLAGFVAMFLAYAGSRFVLEVVLHRV